MNTLPFPRILLAESTLHTRVLIKKLLAPLTCTIDEAENGRQALAKFGEYHPDLVILDSQMPFMNGLETCQELRRLGNPDLPVLLMLPEQHTLTDEEIYAAQASDIVSKPLNQMLFTLRIRHILRNRQAQLKLRYEHQQLCSAMEHNKTGLWAWSPNINGFECSHGMDKLFNIEPGGADIPYAQWMSAIVEEDRSPFMDAFEHCLENSGAMDININVQINHEQRQQFHCQAWSFYRTDIQQQQIIGTVHALSPVYHGACYA